MTGLRNTILKSDIYFHPKDQSAEDQSGLHKNLQSVSYSLSKQ